MISNIAQGASSPPSLRESVKDVVQDFFDRCDIPYQVLPFDTELWDACITRLAANGHHVDPTPTCIFFKTLKVGVTIASAAYSHLNDTETLIWIALFTAYATYADDAFEQDNRYLQSFVHKFIQGECQEHPVLEAFSKFLRITAGQFDFFVANTIVSATLRFIMAMAIEMEGQDVPLSIEATEYPAFARSLSGVAEVYALFAFPPHLPRLAYIQAFPEQMFFINMTNDVLSFYKEELNCETSNFISVTAKSQQRSKLAVLTHTAERSILAYQVILNVLKPCPEAVHAWKGFSKGYLLFHASSTRYKLEELLA